jgi:phosphoglycolate phosphatase-like HAD superfamily hydrolase
MLDKKGYIFDFDGTLVDTMGGFADIAGRVINKFHPAISFGEARRRYLETSGIPFFQQLEIICANDPTNPKKAEIFEEEKKTGFFGENFSQDVKKTVSSLRKEGKVVGVSSNNFQELVDRFVAKEDLKFDLVLGFKKGFEKGKDHFQFFMKRYNLDSDSIVFVGDSLKDAERALTNGITFIGLCGTFTSEDFKNFNRSIKTIKNISEILDL